MHTHYEEIDFGIDYSSGLLHQCWYAEISKVSLNIILLHKKGTITSDPDPYFRQLRTGNRIVGGDLVAEGEIPWQVSIQDTYNQHLCGGTIINQFYIITAAHCSE